MGYDSRAARIDSDSLGGTATLIQGGRCTLVSVIAVDTTGADAYVQLFDAAAAGDISLGTTIADWVIVTNGAAQSVSEPHQLPPDGLVFDKGIVAASTTTALNSTGATQHVHFAIV